MGLGYSYYGQHELLIFGLRLKTHKEDEIEHGKSSVASITL